MTKYTHLMKEKVPQCCPGLQGKRQGRAHQRPQAGEAAYNKSHQESERTFNICT